MKIASLVIGIVLMILAGISFVVCLALPAMTNNRVSFEESLLGLIPSDRAFSGVLVDSYFSNFRFQREEISAPGIDVLEQ